jgi:hypothetical protein
LFTSLGLSLVACDDSEKTPEPATVRQGVSQNLAAVLPELQAALASDATARVPLDEAQKLFDLIQPGSGEAVLAKASHLNALAEGPSLDSDKLGPLLEKHLFSDANHRGDGVYPITAQLACATTYDPQTGEPGPILDADCQAQIEKLAPKIKVRGDANELSFSLLLGPSESAPLELTLSKTEVALHVDLGETDELIKDLAKASNEPAPNFRADGKVAVGLEVLGPKHVELRVEIEDAIDLAFAPAGVSLDSAEAIRFSSDASKIFAFEVDAVAEAVTAGINVGVTKLHTPAEDSDPAIDLDLPGLSGALVVQKGQPVKINGISLGARDLTVKANGQLAATVSLNATNGRKVDITISENAGEAQLVFAPAFDLKMDVNRSLLGDDGEPYQVTRVLIDGTTPTLSSYNNLLRVSSGHLLITTDPAEFGVEANVNQCIGERLLGGLEVVPCSL